MVFEGKNNVESSQEKLRTLTTSHRPITYIDILSWPSVRFLFGIEQNQLITL